MSVLNPSPLFSPVGPPRLTHSIDETGPSNATRGIFVIYDIFGYSPQILQGADILATSDHEKQYKLFMPDFLGSEAAQLSWWGLPDGERQAKLGALFGGIAKPTSVAEKIQACMKELTAKHPNITSWGILGYCFGGKCEALALAKDGHPFKAGAQCHPAMLDPQDAAKIEIPIAILASQDEGKDAVEKYEKALKAGGKSEMYPDMVHGWMAARGELEKDNVKNEYLRGYRSLLDWFHAKL